MTTTLKSQKPWLTPTINRLDTPGPTYWVLAIPAENYWRYCSSEAEAHTILRQYES